MASVQITREARLIWSRRRLLQGGAAALVTGVVSQERAFGSTASKTPGAVRGDPNPLQMMVPFRPSLARIAGRGYLVYEINLTNVSGPSFSLLNLQVLDAQTDAVLAAYGRSELMAMLGRPDGGPTGSPLKEGERALLYLSVPFATDSAPGSLRHRATGSRTGGERSATVIVDEPISIDTRSLPLLGSPLRGGPWTAVYDPTMERGHRRVVYTVDGRARISGRFAIDWMRPSSGAGSRSYSDALGSDVLAVADGVIVAAHDGVPQSTPGEAQSDRSRGDAAGNYIALALGNDRFAFYEHLMPELRVRPGDRVRRGRVIARLGSTGEASEPHLHFHVGNANSPLGAEGLPYELDGFHTLGAYASIAAFGAGDKWTGTTLPVPSKLDTGLPEAMTVVAFST